MIKWNQIWSIFESSIYWSFLMQHELSWYGTYYVYIWLTVFTYLGQCFLMFRVSVSVDILYLTSRRQSLLWWSCCQTYALVSLDDHVNKIYKLYVHIELVLLHTFTFVVTTMNFFFFITVYLDNAMTKSPNIGPLARRHIFQILTIRPHFDGTFLCHTFLLLYVLKELSTYFILLHH